MAEIREGWVRLKTPSNGIEFDAPRKAYEQTYKAKGYALVEDPAAKKAEPEAKAPEASRVAKAKEA